MEFRNKSKAPSLLYLPSIRLPTSGLRVYDPRSPTVAHGCLIVFAAAGKLPFRKGSMAGEKISGASIWAMWPGLSITSRRAFGETEGPEFGAFEWYHIRGTVEDEDGSFDDAD